MSPESEFMKYPDIQEVYENELTLDFFLGNVSCPTNCDGITAEDYANGMQEGMNHFLSFYSKPRNKLCSSVTTEFRTGPMESIG